MITSLLSELLGGKAYAASNYIINTVAGTGSYGYSGDGGNATSAELNHPFGVAIDSSEHLYIADYQNNRIRKVDSSGTIRTIAGVGVDGYSGDGGAATSAELNYPMGVAADNSGNVYISDTANGRIRKVDAAGIINTIAGKGNGGYSGDGGPAALAQLNSPTGIAVDSSGNLYIADQSNHRIRKIDRSGTISTIAGTGTSGYSGDGGPAALAQLNSPSSIAVDSSGNLYIADFYNSRIRKVDVLGTISTVAGTGDIGYSGDEELATSVQLNYPAGVAVDRQGQLYIADTGNYRIRKVDASGIIRTIAGTGSSGYSGDGDPATSAQLANPYGLAVGNSGDLYISDVSSQRIRKLSMQSVVVFAGTSIPMVGADNVITLTVKNSQGNTDTSFNGVHDVTISGYLQAPDHSYGSFNGTALSASPTTISVSFASGVAAGKLKLNKAGAQTINISVADVASPAAKSLIIMPAAGRAASMALPTDIKAPASNGGTFSQQPVVTLLDAYGNTSAEDNSTIVTASKKDTGVWALTGTATATAHAGVVAFSGLGATNAAMVTGAKLSFEAAGLTPVESTAVTLPMPIYTGKIITRLWPVPYNPDLPHVDDDDPEKFKKIDGNVYLTNEPYADVLFTTKFVDQLHVDVNDRNKGEAVKDPSGSLVVIEGAGSLKIDSSDPINDTNVMRFVAQPVSKTGSQINIRATSNARSESESVVLLQAPTVISLNVPDQLEAGTTITINGYIDTKARLPISITTTQGWINTNTDDQGHFSFVYSAPLSAKNETIKVEAPGVEQQLIRSWGVTIYEPLIITTPDTCYGTTGNLFTCQLAAAGGIGDRTWSIESGSLPSGVDLDRRTGLISGTPTSSGTYPITAAVLDSTDEKQTKTITIHIEPKAIFPAPSGLIATAGDGEVVLSWEPVAGATYYDIYEGRASGSYLVLARITNYTGSYSIRGLPNNITRYYVVKAGNDEVESDYSEEVSATPQALPPSMPQWPDSSVLTASDITQTNVNLSWPTATDNVRVTGYRIYVNGTEHGVVSESANTTTVDGLRADTIYTFEVTAFDEEGNESAALTASAKTLPRPAKPDAEAPQWPNGVQLTVSEIAQTSVKLSWPIATDNVGVTGYRIYIDGKERTTVSGSVYAAILDNLKDNTTYTFEIRAYDAAGNESTPISKQATTSRSSSGGGSSGNGPGGGHSLSSNADLEDLQVWDKDAKMGLSPSFTTGRTHYTTRTEAKQVEIAVKPVHAAAKVKLKDSIITDRTKVQLEEGDNKLVLIVQAENGSTKEYTITIHREMPMPSESVPHFTDIAGHWAETGIIRAAAEGILSGHPDGTFKPNHPVTRAEFTVMLIGALQLEAKTGALVFNDIGLIGAWAKQSVAQAVQAGIVDGFKDGSFRPNVQITRVEMAVMIARSLKLPLQAHTRTGFADDQAIPLWAKGSVETIRALGIASGREGNKFVPGETATRAEAVTMLLRMLEYKAGESERQQIQG